MPKQIKPDVHELSLAFSPANLKKFFLRKEEGTKPIESEDAGLLSKLFKSIYQGVKNMTKEELVKKLVEDAQYPFKKEDEKSLKGMSEETLNILVKMSQGDGETDEQKNARIAKEKEDLKKELEPVLRKQIEDELKKSGTDQQKMISDLTTEVKTLTTDLTKTKEALGKEIESRKIVEFKDFIKVNNIPGDVDKLVKTLVLLEKSDPEGFNTYKETLVNTGKMLTTAGIFSESGGVGDGTAGGTAYKQLQTKKDQLMKDKPDMKEADAWRQVVRANAELYKDYQKELRERRGRSSDED